MKMKKQIAAYVDCFSTFKMPIVLSYSGKNRTLYVKCKSMTMANRISTDILDYFGFGLQFRLVQQKIK